MDLTPDELKLVIKCVKVRLDSRKHYIEDMRETARFEPRVTRKWRRFRLIEIPQLTKLLNKLKGKTK